MPRSCSTTDIFRTTGSGSPLTGQSEVAHGLPNGQAQTVRAELHGHVLAVVEGIHRRRQALQKPLQRLHSKEREQATVGRIKPRPG